MSNCDFYVRDKFKNIIHKVGVDKHDSIWVDSNGTVHYHNLQNGDGCGSNSIEDDKAGYEFCPMMDGNIDEIYLDKHKSHVIEYDGSKYTTKD